MKAKFDWKVLQADISRLEAGLNELEADGFEIHQIEFRDEQYRAMHGYNVVIVAKVPHKEPSVYEKQGIRSI